jgi:hypothetical protein
VRRHKPFISRLVPASAGGTIRCIPAVNELAALAGSAGNDESTAAIYAGALILHLLQSRLSDFLDR